MNVSFASEHVHQLSNYTDLTTKFLAISNLGGVHVLYKSGNFLLPRNGALGTVAALLRVGKDRSHTRGRGKTTCRQRESVKESSLSPSNEKPSLSWESEKTGGVSGRSVA